ncbi:hypothetical protein DLM75_12185 [Leptospira stimsonii]|uniref:Uncharacterized protein n=1 Tax=Leptospira stimsonii TaxID=2202203 RepID=A0A396Z7R8_9LEPT|nr:hypothetical protein DLM75_12185 [Leptospira stimsonii]
MKNPVSVSKLQRRSSPTSFPKRIYKNPISGDLGSFPFLRIHCHREFSFKISKVQIGSIEKVGFKVE